MKEIYLHTMASGIASQGMPPWAGVLSEKPVAEIYAFLLDVQDKERKQK